MLHPIINKLIFLMSNHSKIT